MKPLLLLVLVFAGCSNPNDVEIKKLELQQSKVSFFQCGEGTTAKCECVPSK